MLVIRSFSDPFTAKCALRGRKSDYFSVRRSAISARLGNKFHVLSPVVLNALVGTTFVLLDMYDLYRRKNGQYARNI